MDVLHLIKPDAAYAGQITSYREEFLDSGSSMDGTGSLRYTADPLEWLRHIDLFARKETVPENMVQGTQFIYVRESDGKIVGMLQVRHYFNDYLEKYGGHIGYSVRPSERRKGYASRMLKDSLPYCAELGFKKVLLTCHEANEGSRRTILSCGGVYESTALEPDEGVRHERYWITVV